MADVKYLGLTHVKPTMFEHPDNLTRNLLEAFDAFLGELGSSVIILSDYRPGDPRQHGLGRAIDFTVPNVEPLYVWNLLRRVNLFSGLGIYANEKGAVSFHVDTRVGRSVEDPALWGGLIAVGADGGREMSYTTAAAVTDLLSSGKEIAGLVVVGLVLALLALQK